MTTWTPLAAKTRQTPPWRPLALLLQGGALSVAWGQMRPRATVLFAMTRPSDGVGAATLLRRKHDCTYEWQGRGDHGSLERHRQGHGAYLRPQRRTPRVVRPPTARAGRHRERQPEGRGPRYRSAN